MSLKHAILSMVLSQPKSGYDIAKEFSGSVGFYWEASHQQIYKTLSVLEDSRWLRVKEVSQSGKPDKRDYSITSLGRKALLEWIEQPTKIPPKKNALLLKLLALEEVGAEVLVKQLLNYQSTIKQQLQVYRGIEAEFFEDGVKAIKCMLGVSQFLALRRGITFAEGELMWLLEALEIVESLR